MFILLVSVVSVHEQKKLAKFVEHAPKDIEKILIIVINQQLNLGKINLKIVKSSSSTVDGFP
jgi:hypothetical protein